MVWDNTAQHRRGTDDSYPEKAACLGGSQIKSARISGEKGGWKQTTRQVFLRG